MFEPFPLSSTKRLEISDIDEQTRQFVAALPGVSLCSLSYGRVHIEIPTGVMAKHVAVDPNGNETWLYRCPNGEVLGHDTEGALPECVWPATEAIWQTSTLLECEQACYEGNLAASRISPDTPPPNPADDDAIED